MPKFAANLSMLFTELPFIERFAAAAGAGFEGIEFLFPYAFQADELARHLTENRQRQVLFNMPPGDWDAGERGLACLSDRREEFRDGVAAALDYARALGCRQVHCMAGLAPADADGDACRNTYVDNLRFAAQASLADGIKVLIEPINTRDMPGYFLNRTEQAIGIIADVGMPNVALQFDCYHMHIMEGDVAAALERHLATIAHVQIADAPGRHEPGTGEINYHDIFRHLDNIGYGGWVGCEYRPKSDTLASLSWMKTIS